MRSHGGARGGSLLAPLRGAVVGPCLCAVLCLTLCALTGARAAAAAEPAVKATAASAAPSLSRTVREVPFAPFDAGTPRPVKRQGVDGKSRRSHPMVGVADKVPGEGPPPPPLRIDADVPEVAVANPNTVGSSLSSNPLWLHALLYQNVITRFDGPRCQHLPTCSRFASQAVAKHGVLGIVMGLDRLIQPSRSSALRQLPEVEAFGSMRTFDPVENYEFWRPERFTGFPALTAEEPLVLAPLSPPVVISQAPVESNASP